MLYEVAQSFGKFLYITISTKKPSSPFRIVSAGPLGQSKATHGSPQPIASSSTNTKPS